MGNKARKNQKITEQLLLATFTAVLAAVLSLLGFYFNSKIQLENDRYQKQFEHKANAYNSFLTSINRNEPPIIAEILNIGELSRYVGTDSEIQRLENSFERLTKLNEEYKISWQLDSDFNILRLHGSELVQKYCDDMLAALALREFTIDWKQYSEELQELRRTWVEEQSREAYGFDAKISSEERAMFILLSGLYKNLIGQLHKELKES